MGGIKMEQNYQEVPNIISCKDLPLTTIGVAKSSLVTLILFGVL